MQEEPFPATRARRSAPRARPAPTMQAGDDLLFMRQGFYWLHLETDSVVVRAEKEELFLKLSYGSSEDVTSKQVLCFSNRRWHNRTRVGACGNTRALPAIMRHTSTEVNLYSWPTSVGQTIVTVSLAAGACGNPMFGGICNSVLGHCSLHEPNRPQLARVCNSTPGVGVDYWRGLFETVTKLRLSVGEGRGHGARLQPLVQESLVRPNAVVLSYGLHFPHCDNTTRYQQHIEFWLSSLQVLYDGPIVWRSVSPPQFDADLHSHPPTGCLSRTNVTRLDAVVRSTLQTHGATFINTATVVAGWANATADTIHYDGGVLRQWHARSAGCAVHRQCTLRDQSVSIALLGALLAKLRVAGRGRGS
jgi:hypothetical protein